MLIDSLREENEEKQNFADHQETILEHMEYKNNMAGVTKYTLIDLSSLLVGIEQEDAVLKIKALHEAMGSTRDNVYCSEEQGILFAEAENAILRTIESELITFETHQHTVNQLKEEINVIKKRNDELLRQIKQVDYYTVKHNDAAAETFKAEVVFVVTRKKCLEWSLI